MEIDEIHDRNSLKQYLSNDWYHQSRAIAYRAALRTLPAMQLIDKNWLATEALTMFRALLIASIKLHDYYQDATRPVTAAFIKVDDPGFTPKEIVYGPARRSAAAALQAMIHDNPKIADAACDAVMESVRYLGTRIWPEVVRDCQLNQDALMTGSVEQVVRGVANFRLWDFQWPPEWLDSWKNLRESLQEIDANFDVWTLWFERRLPGEQSAFYIPNDMNREWDRYVLRQLAEATEQNFWGKGHEHVNTTLKSWLEEARGNALQRNPPPIISAASGIAFGSSSANASAVTVDLSDLPFQNTNALSFRADDEGRITINATALADQLRTDEGARDRHAEAVSEARSALGRCQGNNAAARLTGLLGNYLSAAGERPETAKPSLLVQRGERLRQELARYEAPDNMLPPVADDVLLDLKGWLSAHNMMVGLDPVLMASDTAMLGPDRQPALIPPDEIRDKALKADEAGILADGVAEIVVEAADLAPAIPDASNRRTLWSVEACKNLIIECFAIALNPSKAELPVVAMTAHSGFRALIGSVEHQKYLVENREWIIARLGTTPEWQAVFAKLIDRVEENTPFKPG